MATVNIGSLKFNWKGAYNGSTAYAIDDVTEYNGSSYICILASTGNLPTNTTYFQPMATKGTDGTDVGTTLTTQGDILYRDGSGLQRLAAGTANQVLQSGGSGANPSWGTVSSDYVKLATADYSSAVSSVTLDNIFSSTYRGYKIHIDNPKVASGNYELAMRYLDGSGNVITTSNYYSAMGGTYKGAASGTVNGDDSGQSYARLFNWNIPNNSESTFSSVEFGRMDVNDRHAFVSSSYVNDHNGPYRATVIGCGDLQQTTVVRGVQFFPRTASVNFTSYSITVWGLK